MAPPPERNIDHLSAGLDKAKSRQIDPVETPPILLIAVDQLIEIRHGDSDDAPQVSESFLLPLGNKWPSRREHVRERVPSIFFPRYRT